MFETAIKPNQTRLDWVMLSAVIGLMIIGAAFVHSARLAEDAETAWHSQLWVRQLVWYGAGLGCVIGFCLIDYHVWARWSLVLYWATILMLILVLVPFIGQKVGGARRWFDLGFFKLQPSEFAKISFIFIQAHFLSRPADELGIFKVFMKALGLVALPFVLIMFEPDLGSALVLLPTSLITLYVAGAPVRFLRRLVVFSTLLVGLILVDVLFAPPNWQIKLHEYQRHRLMVFFGQDFAPESATPEQKRKARQLQEDKSFQVDQAMIAVGSGGFWGKGWRQGTQTALKFLPQGAAHNDFIFSVIAEEKGFAGSVTVITLFGLILFSGIRIAGQARDRLGKLLAVGVVALLFSHVFINIGMNTRLMPVTGVPLPLLSYGGSSVVCSLIAIGILQNIYIYRRS